MRSFVASAALGIVSVASVLVLIVVHGVLAAIANRADRFMVARRWLSVAVAVLSVILAIVIIARFYYLRN